MEIIIDSREQSLREWLPKQFPDLTFKVEALKEGDYLANCDNGVSVLVERKRFSDLYGSVMGSNGKKGRFPYQLSRLTTHQSDKVVILLITESIDEFIYNQRKHGRIIDPDIFDGIIASVLVRDNIRVIIDPNEKNGLKRMVRVMLKICENQLDTPSLRNLDALMSRLLNISLISWKSIKNIHGCDLCYLSKLSDSELMKCEGIGKVKAKKIKEILNGKSTDWFK